MLRGRRRSRSADHGPKKGGGRGGSSVDGNRLGNNNNNNGSSSNGRNNKGGRGNNRRAQSLERPTQSNGNGNYKYNNNNNTNQVNNSALQRLDYDEQYSTDDGLDNSVGGDAESFYGGGSTRSYATGGSSSKRSGGGGTMSRLFGRSNHNHRNNNKRPNGGGANPHHGGGGGGGGNTSVPRQLSINHGGDNNNNNNNGHRPVHHQQQLDALGYEDMDNRNYPIVVTASHNNSINISSNSQPPSTTPPNSAHHHHQSLASVSDIERLAQKKGANPIDERFLVLPDDSYPDTYMTRRELREEMNRKSQFFHDLRLPAKKSHGIGVLRFEILQCFGLPTASLVRETSAYGVAVVGSHAFKTDVMPPVANPMWLSKMRRACAFPLSYAYARLFVGIFDAHVSTGGHATANRAEDFLGRIVLDVARLRPGCVYDVTLPLRQSAHIHTKQPQGAVRIRVHLVWHSERAAVLSYLPSAVGIGRTTTTSHKAKDGGGGGGGAGGGGNNTLSRSGPNTSERVYCLDDQSFRDVALTVHGVHMPGKFTLTLLKGTVREINFTRIHVMRYVRKRETYNLRYWVYPSISAFVFVAWAHAVYCSTVRYVPGHVVVLLLLHLYKNYAYYAMDSPLQNGFVAPTVEELYASLMHGTRRRTQKRPCIQPLTMERDDTHVINPLYDDDDDDGYFGGRTGGGGGGGQHPASSGRTSAGGVGGAANTPVPLSEIAESMRKSIPVTGHRHGFRLYKNCFLGKEAVDFLVMFGYARSRPEAVALGRRLAKEVRLFEHVDRQHELEDDKLFYHFLEYDTGRYKIKSCHTPKGRKLLEYLGFYDRGPSGEILEAREHIEFPFAQGVDHPRFTVKESLVIRSAESKKILKDQQEATELADCAEFGVVGPTAVQTANASAFMSDADSDNGDADHHHHVATGGHNDEPATVTGVVAGAGEMVKRTARRASLVASTVTTAVTALPNNVVQTAAYAAQNAVQTAQSAVTSVANTVSAPKQTNIADGLHVGDPDEIYDKLRSRNPTLDEVIEQHRLANEYDPYAYDSDNDVDDVQKKRRKNVIIEEKTLRKPPDQDFSKKAAKGDKAFSKAVQEARHKVHGLLLHMFNDHVYTVDKNLFPTTQDHDANKDGAVANKKKKRLGVFGRRVSNDDQKDEQARRKQSQMTPYDARQDEYDRILMINKYSHGNPWINRVAVVIQPIVEIAQAWLFLFRALFNVYTWQDPILSFWFAFLGPILVVILYVAPYRLIFGVLGLYLVGPQNYAIRLYRESRPGYQPPDFDKIIKKKKPAVEESYRDLQFFSSEAPGNQQIHFQNVDPTQVKQVVVPSNVLKYSRFYDWPPEPEYARVYAAPPPRNQYPSRVGDAASGSEYDSESDFEGEAYYYDAAKPRPKKKKKKKGLKKLTHQMKKGTMAVSGATLSAGGAIVSTTMSTTGSVVHLTASTAAGVSNVATKATRKAVKGTGKVTKKAVKGTTGLFGMRRRRNYSDDEGEEY